MRIKLWGFAVLLLFLAVVFPYGTKAQEQPALPTLSSEQLSDIGAFAQRLRKELKTEGCSDSGCRVLVMNFALSSAETCSACILLSDALTKALTDPLGGPTAVTRADLGSFMDRERIASQYLIQKETLSWIANELQANRIIFGILEPRNDSLELKAKVLKHFGDTTEISQEIHFKLPMGDLAGALAAQQFFQPLPRREPPLDGTQTPIPVANTPGLTMPRCLYLPNPGYTDAARHAKLNSGVVLLEVIVTVQGRIVSPRIVRGLPFGLNEISLETIRTWRCQPATKDGLPVPVVVPIEITFNLH